MRNGRSVPQRGRGGRKGHYTKTESQEGIAWTSLQLSAEIRLGHSKGQENTRIRAKFETVRQKEAEEEKHLAEKGEDEEFSTQMQRGSMKILLWKSLLLRERLFQTWAQTTSSGGRKWILRCREKARGGEHVSCGMLQ